LDCNLSFKKSRYNIVLPYDQNQTIIYNTLSGAIGLMDVETKMRFDTDNLSPHEFNVFKSKGIIIPADYNEKTKVDSDRVAGIINKGKKHFRIWPTSGCNANCYYCFEKGIKANTMNIETANGVIKYITGFLQQNDTLEIEWFGGEPLLNTEVIDHISSKLIDVCNDLNCKFSSTIISNGSIIDDAIASKMKDKWKVKLIQITLDGFSNDYDLIKNYNNKKLYNFYRVIDNIRKVAECGIHVSLRMNYDTTNYESLVKLINYLKHELSEYDDIYYYVYPVWSSFNEGSRDYFYSKTKADLNMLKLFDLIVTNGLNTPRQVSRLGYKPNQCLACSDNSFTILPDGSITKCSEAFFQVIGNIKEGIIDIDMYNYWTRRDLDQKCVECEYLPICQGGCTASHFNQMPQCFGYRQIIEEVIKWYVDKMIEKRSQINLR